MSKLEERHHVASTVHGDGASAAVLRRDQPLQVAHVARDAV